jgi:hypothetical protein
MIDLGRYDAVKPLKTDAANHEKKLCSPIGSMSLMSKCTIFTKIG